MKYFRQRSMKYFRLGLSLALLALVMVAGLHAQQVADSLPGAIPPSGAINYTTGILLGALGSVVAGVAGAGANWVDRQTGAADAWLRDKVGPVLPLVAGLAPLVSNLIGVTDLPPAAVIATMPVSAISGVFFREAARKWVLPAIGKLF